MANQIFNQILFSAVSTGRVAGPSSSTITHKEVQLKALQDLTQMWAVKTEKMFSYFEIILEGTAKTLGVRPPLEDNLREKMKNVFESCLDSWKAKIQDGVTNNREVILVEDEITISQLKPIKKRSRPSESTSTANKKTRTSNNPSSLGNNAGDAMAAAGLSGAAQKGKGKEKEKASSKKPAFSSKKNLNQTSRVLSTMLNSMSKHAG
ncbi:hypothetical protein VP01_1057g3 [Puccinia sorghi]|uniref:Uncharacterized protein n=1 Tax=Puccinia sorghi TaxID=27349 RepID=A0A0L6VTZ4_9BASI|nr:hypothetical protein VP01_1057g3 [Puccinia sorghi]